MTIQTGHPKWDSWWLTESDMRSQVSDLMIVESVSARMSTPSTVSVGGHFPLGQVMTFPEERVGAQLDLSFTNRYDSGTTVCSLGSMPGLSLFRFNEGDSEKNCWSIQSQTTATVRVGPPSARFWQVPDTEKGLSTVGKNETERPVFQIVFPVTVDSLSLPYLHLANESETTADWITASFPTFTLPFVLEFPLEQSTLVYPWLHGLVARTPKDDAGILDWKKHCMWKPMELPFIQKRVAELHSGEPEGLDWKTKFWSVVDLQFSELRGVLARLITEGVLHPALPQMYGEYWTNSQMQFFKQNGALPITIPVRFDPSPADASLENGNSFPSLFQRVLLHLEHLNEHGEPEFPPFSSDFSEASDVYGSHVEDMLTAVESEVKILDASAEPTGARTGTVAVVEYFSALSKVAAALDVDAHDDNPYLHWKGFYPQEEIGGWENYTLADVPASLRIAERTIRVIHFCAALRALNIIVGATPEGSEQPNSARILPSDFAYSSGTGAIIGDDGSLISLSDEPWALLAELDILVATDPDNDNPAYEVTENNHCMSGAKLAGETVYDGNYNEEAKLNVVELRNTSGGLQMVLELMGRMWLPALDDTDIPERQSFGPLRVTFAFGIRADMSFFIRASAEGEVVLEDVKALDKIFGCSACVDPTYADSVVPPCYTSPVSVWKPDILEGTESDVGWLQAFHANIVWNELRTDSGLAVGYSELMNMDLPMDRTWLRGAQSCLAPYYLESLQGWFFYRHELLPFKEDHGTLEAHFGGLSSVDCVEFDLDKFEQVECGSGTGDLRAGAVPGSGVCMVTDTEQQALRFASTRPSDTVDSVASLTVLEWTEVGSLVQPWKFKVSEDNLPFWSYAPTPAASKYVLRGAKLRPNGDVVLYTVSRVQNLQPYLHSEFVIRLAKRTPYAECSGHIGMFLEWYLEDRDLEWAVRRWW